jgi:hypothetical protein
VKWLPLEEVFGASGEQLPASEDMVAVIAELLASTEELVAAPADR